VSRRRVGVVDRLVTMRGPGESYSDVLIRAASIEILQAAGSD
jgi:hypothetical protein